MKMMSPKAASWYQQERKKIAVKLATLIRTGFYRDAVKYNDALLELNRLREEATR